MDFKEEKEQVQSQPQPQIQPQVVLREVGQRSDNRLAVTSVVLGIITLVFFWFPILSLITGIIGLVIAIIALIKEERKGMPILGMVLCIIGITLAGLIAIGYMVQYLAYSNGYFN
ncbi:MAG TPA: hypothetical protein DD414_08725 [Lachnospiraceae bacterium]|nr:hypothetical protein [Lachnospiraceae bacterium]